MDIGWYEEVFGSRWKWNGTQYCFQTVWHSKANHSPPLTRPTESFSIEQVDATVGRSGGSTLYRTHQSHQVISVSGTEPDRSALHSIPTKGDGRCFFRAISIALTPDLQSCQQNPLTGDMLNQVKSLYETAQADNLRSRLFQHMCVNLRVGPGAAELNADMPGHLQFQTIVERISHMSKPQAYVGELEIRSTAGGFG